MRQEPTAPSITLCADAAMEEAVATPVPPAAVAAAVSVTTEGMKPTPQANKAVGGNPCVAVGGNPCVGQTFAGGNPTQR